MNRTISQIALVVKDYDEAITFYTRKLNFRLLEDIKLSETKRWVVVSPQGEADAIYYWPKLQTRNKSYALAIKPEDVYFFFYIPMTFGEITIS